jgi:chromosome segregation ATPase
MLGLSGDEILYIGDHIYVDVNVSKTLFRWRTALVLRELEHDIRAVTCFQQQEMELNRLMQQKIRLEKEISQSRLNLQYVQASASEDPMRLQKIKHHQDQIQTTRAQVIELDASIQPLLQEAAQLNNTRWGLLMRAGNDKTHLARQLERHADIYMSRVSNLKAVTPYAYLRAQAGTLPHDLELMF